MIKFSITRYTIFLSIYYIRQLFITDLLLRVTENYDQIIKIKTGPHSLKQVEKNMNNTLFAASVQGGRREKISNSCITRLK